MNFLNNSDKYYPLFKEDELPAFQTMTESSTILDSENSQSYFHDEDIFSQREESLQERITPSQSHVYEPEVENGLNPPEPRELDISFGYFTDHETLPSFTNYPFNKIQTPLALEEVKATPKAYDAPKKKKKSPKPKAKKNPKQNFKYRNIQKKILREMYSQRKTILRKLNSSPEVKEACDIRLIFWYNERQTTPAAKAKLFNAHPEFKKMQKQEEKLSDSELLHEIIQNTYGPVVLSVLETVLQNGPKKNPAIAKAGNYELYKAFYQKTLTQIYTTKSTGSVSTLSDHIPNQSFVSFQSILADQEEMFDTTEVFSHC